MEVLAPPVFMEVLAPPGSIEFLARGSLVVLAPGFVEFP